MANKTQLMTANRAVAAESSAAAAVFSSSRTTLVHVAGASKTSTDKGATAVTPFDVQPNHLNPRQSLLCVKGEDAKRKRQNAASYTQHDMRSFILM